MTSSKLTFEEFFERVFTPMLKTLMNSSSSSENYTTIGGFPVSFSSFDPSTAWNILAPTRQRHFENLLRNGTNIAFKSILNKVFLDSNGRPIEPEPQLPHLIDSRLDYNVALDQCEIALMFANNYKYRFCIPERVSHPTSVFTKAIIFAEWSRLSADFHEREDIYLLKMKINYLHKINADQNVIQRMENLLQDILREESQMNSSIFNP